MTALRQRQPRQENGPHRRFVASLPCLICAGRDVQCAHVRYADLSIAKPFTGRTKPDDKYTVPLCCQHHREQHDCEHGERWWWYFHEIDPIKVALALFAVTGDSARGELIVSSCREQRAA